MGTKCKKNRQPPCDENAVCGFHETALEAAKKKLCELSVYSPPREPRFTGLGGWVFEQTIQSCLECELKHRGIRTELREEISLGGRAKADLGIADLAIEIKSRGLFSRADVERYGGYKRKANELGLKYLFITREESYQPYRDGIEEALGRDNVFFLDKPGHWQRFVTRVVRAVKDS